MHLQFTEYPMRRHRYQCRRNMLIVLFALLLNSSISMKPSSSTASGISMIPDIRNHFCNASDALEFAILCQSLYGSSTTLDDSQSQESQYNVHFHNDEFWIGMSSTKLVVTFGGHEGIAGDDVQVPLGPTGREFHNKVMMKKNATAGVDHISVLVHRGFNHVFESSYDKIISILVPLLQQHEQQKKSVYFIGHAIGGARAMLVGTYFAFHHPTIATHVQTFGQQRCGNLGFKILLESIRNLNAWRIVNNRDPIIRGPFDNYYHAGHLLWRRESNGELSDQDFAYQAFYRTIGNPQLGFAGIDDLSIASKSYAATQIPINPFFLDACASSHLLFTQSELLARP